MKGLEKKTKIIATLGPRSDSLEVMESLLRRGVDVFRFNFSHGSPEEHEKRLALATEAASRTGRFPALLADLQGPKIRLGRTENDREVRLVEGDRVALTSDPVPCTRQVLSIDYPPLLQDLRPGNAVLLNDGAIELEVESVDLERRRAVCLVRNTGTFSSRKGVNFPRAALSVPSVTAKDMRDLDFVFEHGFHFVALSFVRSARDLAPLKDAVGKSGAFLKIIAKIEKPEAAERIEEILDCCDGIMVARGDLGVEASLWTVPILQKDLIRRARTKGRVVIVATQMLESMIEHPVPTRAETTDVANAILDGADAVMLSGETAVGRYPVETVETMARILKVTEASSYFSRELAGIETPSLMPPHAVCEAAATASRDLGDIPIVVFTLSGDTAWYMANIRPQAPLIAFSSSRRVVAQLALAWNTIAFELPFEGNVVRLIKMAETKLLETGCLAFHDSVVIVCGTTSVHGATNFMQIRQLGEQ